MATKSKTKIYYWLKFDKHFFDNLFIKRLLKNFPGGSDMIVIYIRLMLEAIENDCIIDYEGTFDSYAEELALRLEVSEEQINMTLAYFVKCGVIQVDNDGNTHYPQAKALLGQETNWNRYKKKQAELEKFQPLSNQLPTEIEKDIELELDKELESEKDISSSSCINNKELIKRFEKEFGRLLSPYEIERVIKWVTDDNYLPDVIIEALKEAIFKGKPNLQYIQGILRNWKNDNLTTVELIEANRRERENSHSPKNVQASAEFIEAMDLWKDKD